MRERQKEEENPPESNTEEIYVPREDVTVLGLAVQPNEAAEVPKQAVEQDASAYPVGIPTSLHN